MRDYLSLLLILFLTVLSQKAQATEQDSVYIDTVYDSIQDTVRTFNSNSVYAIADTVDKENKDTSLNSVYIYREREGVSPVVAVSTRNKWKPNWRSYESAISGISLVLAGIPLRRWDDDMRSLRNDHTPNYKFWLDNVTQYLPAGVMLGLKIGRVPSRSSWGRMLVSDAFSAAIMAGLVNSLKYSVRTLRPDGSSRNSFPSGHTATVFMTATMLYKEYGYKSPWVGISAYTLATATGLMRMLNNRHWLSDVVTGAGIGILSVELGYLLTDIIFKDRGLIVPDKTGKRPWIENDRNPSNISLYMGIEWSLNKYKIDNDTELTTSAGAVVGLEGAYFWNKYLGIGSRIAVHNLNFAQSNENTNSDRLVFNSEMTGLYVNFPVHKRISIGTNALFGHTYYHSLKIEDSPIIPSNRGFSFGSGINIMVRAFDHLDLKFVSDYSLLPPHSKKSNEYLHSVVTGFTAGFRF